MRTDVRKLMVAFRSFANAPKNGIFYFTFPPPPSPPPPSSSSYFLFLQMVATYIFITGLFSVQVSMAISGAQWTKCIFCSVYVCVCVWTCIHSL